MEFKKCSSCKIEKTFDDFSNRKLSKDGKNNWCKDCFKQYRKKNKKEYSNRDKAYYEKNKEEIKKRVNEYRVENELEVKKKKKEAYYRNHEKNLMIKKEYYEANKEAIILKMGEHQSKNKERYRRYKRNHYNANREKINKKSGEYIKKHREQYNEYKSKRRALKRKNTVGKVDYTEIIKRDDWFCYLCNKSIDDESYHMDHVVPLSKGGEHSMGNIKMTHAICNLIKNNKTVEEARVLIKERAEKEAEQAIEIIECGGQYHE